MIDFKPLGKRLIVFRKKPDAGGLKLTEELERESHPDIGEVFKVGQIGWWNKWIRGIRPGKLIQFTRYSPIKINTVDQEWIYVDLENVLGIQCKLTESNAG